MNINENKIYIILATLLISTQFGYFYTTNGAEHTCGLGYFLAVKYGNLGPKMGFESSFYLPFHVFGIFYNIPYSILLIYALITYGLKLLLNKAIINIPKKLFVIISTLPALIMSYDFYHTFYHPGRLMHFGYILFACSILIGSITIILTLNNISYITLKRLLRTREGGVRSEIEK